MIVRLTAEQVADAYRYAATRTDRNADRGSQPRWGQLSDARRGHDRIGTVAELAVALLLGVADQWDGAEQQQPTGDVAGIEVRATTRPDGRLILHDDDKPDRPYMLVIVPETPAADGSMEVRVRGWYMPGWGLRAEWWHEYRTGGGAYYVPHVCLVAAEPMS